MPDFRMFPFSGAAIPVALSLLLGASGVPEPAQARTQGGVQASSQVTAIPEGTLVRVVLQRALDSTTMDVGD
jgi:hypothetical protein